MKSYIRKLTEVDFSTSSWSGGTTTQLFIYPEDSNYGKKDFKVRISSATVELEESNFTKLEGIYRFITPLDNSLKLSHNGETFTKLNPFEIYEFDGSLNTISFGKAKDFNLMLANGTKGELRNFSIYEDEEIEILTVIGLNILFSYNSNLRIRVDQEEITLSPNELLIIKSDTAKQVKIHSNKNANILVSRIFD